MKGSGSLGSGGDRGAPGRKTGRPHPRAGGAFLSSGPGEGGAADNPWRRAALSIEKERERGARHAKASSVADAPALAESRSRADGRFAIGRLGAPRGTEGDLHVNSYSGEIDHFFRLKAVDLERSSPLHAATRLHLKVARVEEAAGGLTLAFEGYSTRETAERLIGMEIIVDRPAGAPLGRDEWYVADLVGLCLVSEDGSRQYGQVVSVCEGGSDPLLEVVLSPDEANSGRAIEADAMDAGAIDDGAMDARAMDARAMDAGKLGPGAAVFVPFRKEFIGDIDLGKKIAILLAPWALE